MNQAEITIGITHGDINGIGYEVIMKSLADQRILDNATVIVYGSPKVAAFHRKFIDLQNFNFNLIKSADEAVKKKANIINCIDPNIRVEMGMETPEAGEASFSTSTEIMCLMPCAPLYLTTYLSSTDLQSTLDKHALYDQP